MKLVVCCIAPAACVLALACTRRDVNEDRTYGAAGNLNGTTPAGANDQAGRTTTTGANVPGAGTAPDLIHEVAAAQCARIEKCNLVGKGKRYPTGQACMASVRPEVDRQLASPACPGGVDQGKLGSCLTAIRGESCSAVSQGVAHIQACQTAALCR